MEGSGVSDSMFHLSSAESVQPSVTPRGSGDPGDDIVHDLDSFLLEINDRLTISRMVNDSVIKGIVNAVMEDSAERIAQREAEVASLKERLHFYEGGANKVLKSGFSSFSSTLAEQNSARKCLNNLRISAEQQFQMLKKEINDSKACSLMGRLHTLSGFLGPKEMKEHSKWLWVDQNLDNLKNIVNGVFEKVDSIVSLSTTSLYECQREREFQDDIEAMMIQSSIRVFQDELEAKSWEQSALFCGGHKKNQLGKIRQLSGLRQELDALSRYLSSPEIVQLPPHMCHEDGEEWNNTKRKDQFHSKALSNHMSQSYFLREANGKHENSKNTPENLDPAQLKHMSKDDLIVYFKNEMTEMKRNNESFVQQLTEDYFSLMRDYLKETSRSSCLKKDKEFEALRKKIPEVIVTLDDILTESEKVSMIHENDEILYNLKCRIESLVSENRELKDMLKSKRKEIKLLSSQLSSASDEMSQLSLSEATLLEQMEKLECDLKDMKVEFTIREDIYKCIVKELIGEIKWHIEDLDMEFIAMLEFYEIVFGEAVRNAIDTIQCDIEDSDMELIIMQEMCGIIFKEAVKNAEGVIGMLKMKYAEEHEQRISLEASVFDIQKALTLEIEEKERLKREMLLFPAVMEEKKRLGSLLMKERECFEVMNRELTRLRDQASQQEILINEGSRKFQLAKSKLDDAVSQRFLCEEEISKLKQKLNLAMKDLKEANEDRVMLHAIIQEKESTLSLVKSKETENKKQIESTVVSVERLLKTATDFEKRAVKTVENMNARLEKLKSQCGPLVRKANSFKTMELVYKQRLGRRYSDLQKAEAEVDLLGDEVDALLGLLEKIYIALDHYSPILQHYPGIMEILKLIRRELSGETEKPV